MSTGSSDPASAWHVGTRRELRAYSALTLPIALLVLCALGWGLVMHQNVLVTTAAVSAYQETERELARILADTIERYASEQLGEGGVDLAEVEKQAALHYVEPVHLLTSGSAWLYSPERGLVGGGEPRSLVANLVSSVAGGEPTASALATALAAGGEGKRWLAGTPAGRGEVVAWSPVNVGEELLIVGISVPLSEVLSSSGAVGQMRALVAAMGLASVATVGLLVAWLDGERRRRGGEEAERRAQQQLEARVLERTAELRQANEALAESESRYHEFSDSLPQVVFETDARGNITFLNRVGRDILGLREGGHTTGLNALSLVAPADRLRAARAIRRVLNGGGLDGAEYALSASDGTEVPVIVHANAVIRNGVAVGVRGVVINIRERKAAEEALRESERRFRDMLERVQLFAAILDAEGRIVFCNQCLLQATGWRWEEIAGNDWFDTFVPVEARRYLRGRFADYALPGAEPMRHRVQQLVTRDGSVRTVFWNIIALHDAEGRLTGSASIGEDITERLRAERALQESEERYRTLFNNSSEALFVRSIGDGDEPGPLIEVNETACSMLGYTREEMLRLRPEELAAQEPASRVRQWLQLLLERGRCLFETTYQTKDGRGIPVEVSSCLIEYRGQVAVLSTVRDISERRRLEEQLLESRKLESIGRLAGGIAHDFNNMLTAIAGHASFALEDRCMSDGAREELEHLLKASDRAASLTKQLLAFSRRQIISPRLIQINDLITDMAPMLEKMIGADYRLASELADDLGLVSADATQLQQVIANLVVNGRDAMPPGGTVTIRSAGVTVRPGPSVAETDLRPGDYVVISVTDTGEGMTDEVRRRIFEPFFTTKSLGKGTGMGLPTALGIVKQHHGDIRVTSVVGQGTTFEVYLPRSLGQSEPLDDVDLGGQLPLGTETVMVVEDDEQARALMARALRRLGYRVIEAASGEAAEAAMREGEEPVDLLLADVLVASASGDTLARQLLRSRPGLKVLLVSRESTPAGNGKLPGIEPLVVLTRPFSTTALAYTVRQLLDRPIEPTAN